MRLVGCLSETLKRFNFLHVLLIRLFILKDILFYLLTSDSCMKEERKENKKEQLNKCLLFIYFFSVSFLCWSGYWA